MGSFRATVRFRTRNLAPQVQYYDNNSVRTLALSQVMAEIGVFKLVFNSSATAYGDPASLPISEDFPLEATNTYGRSKSTDEGILRDLVGSDARLTGRPVPNRIAGRREGDVAICCANTDLAKMEHGWATTQGSNDMCADL